MMEMCTTFFIDYQLRGKVKVKIKLFLLFYLFFSFLLIFSTCTSKKGEDTIDIVNDWGELKYILKYNDQNSLLESSYFDAGKMRRQIVKEPSSDRVIEENFFSQEGNLLHRAVYTYMENGLLKKKELLGEQDQLKCVTEYVYASDHSLSKVISYDKEKAEKREYTQDQKTGRTKQEIYKEDGKLVSVYQVEGEKIFFSNYGNNGVISSSIQYNRTSGASEERKFNEKGEILSIKKWDGKGLLVEEKEYSFGKEDKRKFYRYDKMGRQIERVEYNEGQNKQKRRYVYTYDKTGKRIKIDIYDQDGKLMEYY